MTTPLIDIRPDHWAIVAEILLRHVPTCEVRAFGSRVTWTAKEYSDLDLAIVTTQPLGHLRMADLREAFEESDLSFKVDVLDLAVISKAFQKIIDKKYVVIQKGEKKDDGMAGGWRASIYGKIAADFFEEPLRSLCDSKAGIQTGPFGSQLHQEDYVPVGTPIITVEHLGENRILHNGVPRVSDGDRDRLSRYLLRKGDIVFSRVGSVDRRALVRSAEDGWMFSGRCLRVRPNPQKIDPGYLSYFFGLPTFKEQIRAIAVGATMPSLNTTLLSDVLVPYPHDIAEQRAIAHILGTLDDKIELNRRMSETLEAMARALFKSWFVDFDPVRAKCLCRGEVTSPLQKPIADLFPDSFEDSELGEIPKGWEVGMLADLSALNPEVWTKQTRPAELNYVDLSNTKWGRIEAVTSYERADAPSRAQRVLRPGDTIVGTVRPGNGSYAFICESGLTGSTGFAALRPQRTEYAELVYLAATAADNVDTLAHLADGAAYPAVRPEVVAATPIVCATEGVSRQFSRAAGPLLAKVARNERESRTLAALRDALLPKLISGELRVQDAERFVKEAV